MGGKSVLSVVFNEFKNDNRVSNQAVSLANHGYDVSILAIRLSETTPSEESIETGVKVIRINRLKGKSILSSVPILDKVLKVLNFQIAFYGFIRKYTFDIIHCHDLNTLEYGVLAKVFKRKIKLVYDAHEYETQRNGLHGWRKVYAKIKERFLIRFCDRAITVSDTIASEYERLYHITKPEVILNCPALRTKDIVKKDLFREKFDIPASKKIFLYQGYLYLGRGIEVALEAFSRLDLEDGILVFMGEGTLESEIKQHEEYGKSVFVHPFVSGEVLLGYTSSADYGIAFIEDISLSYRYSLPNKLFEYIAAGLPVIGSGISEQKKFVEDHQVGATSDTNDVQGFIQAFNKLSQLDLPQLQENIMKTRSLYNWGTQEKVLIDLYRGLQD